MQFYFQWYECDPFMLDFLLFKLRNILLKIHAQQAAHLYQDLEAAAKITAAFFRIRTEYGEILRTPPQIQSKYEKMRTRITPNTDIFYAAE